jgi:hypothetical protein
MSTDRAERYRISMKTHPYGYALFEPQDHTRLRPGMLGFLDEYRHWHPLLDLTDPKLIAAAGFTPLEFQLLSEPDSRQWGPLTASTVKENKIDFGGGISAASLGLPADVSGAVKYNTKADFGAILMCDDKVEAQGYELRTPFLSWLKSNSKALLQKWPDIEEHGVVAATWTYSATQIYIHVWEDSDKTVAIGFKVGATGVGDAHSDTSWHRSLSSDGWSRWDDHRRVVFFTGVKIAYNFFGAHEEREKHWRSHHVKESVVIDHERKKVIEAKVELFGDDWEDIEKARTKKDDDNDK